MVFEIGETNNSKETSEIINALKDFRENYNLNEKHVNYIIEKQPSEIAPYFLIYPKSDKIEIKKVAPVNLNSSHIENLLMDDEKESIILLNDRYFRILKQKPENLKN
jgi:hypothetical protein